MHKWKKRGGWERKERERDSAGLNLHGLAEERHLSWWNAQFVTNVFFKSLHSYIWWAVDAETTAQCWLDRDRDESLPTVVLLALLAATPAITVVAVRATRLLCCGHDALYILERKCEREDAKRICKSTIISWCCSEREWVYILGIVVSLVVVESRERGSFLLYHTKREREREREECLTGRRITLSYLLLAWSHTHTGMMTLLELHNGLQYIVHSRTPSALNSSESSGRRKRECIATCSYANFLQKSCRLPKRRATPMC